MKEQDKIIKFSEIGPFNSDLAFIKQKGKYGFINYSGDFQIPCEYDLICPTFSEGKVAVKQNKKWGYINTDNITVIDFVFDNALSFSEGLAVVRQGKMYGIIDKQGKMMVQPIYNKINQSSNHVFSAKKDKKWGFIDGSGNIILPFIYDSATAFSFGVSYVRIGQRHGFINLQGEFVLELTDKQQIYPKPYHASFATAINFEFIAVANIYGRRKYDWSIYSNKGELIAESLEYTWINTFHNDMAAACNNHSNKQKWGIINSRGEFVIPPEYDKISSFKCDLAFVTKGVYCGYIDKNNYINIPLRYRAASEFYENIAYVSQNGWNGQLIDTKGNTILNLRKEVNFVNITKFVNLYDIR